MLFERVVMLRFGPNCLVLGVGVGGIGPGLAAPWGGVGLRVQVSHFAGPLLFAWTVSLGSVHSCGRVRARLRRMQLWLLLFDHLRDNITSCECCHCCQYLHVEKKF